MKLINETCYSTEDLETLAKRCKESMQECHERSKELVAQEQSGRAAAPPSIGVRAPAFRRVLHLNQNPTTVVRVGYYQPTSNSSWRTGGTYLNAGGYRNNSRLGIVKRSALGIQPLVALAQAADGTVCYLPQEVVNDLVEYFAAHYGSTWDVLPFSKHGYGGDAYADIWEWVQGFKVHYRLRAKRGSKAQVKRAREVAKLKKLRDGLKHRVKDVESLTGRLEDAKNRLAEDEAKIEELAKKLET